MSESIRVIEEPNLADMIRFHMDVQRQAAEAAKAWRVVSSNSGNEDSLTHLLQMETAAQEAVMRYRPTSDEEAVAKLLYLSALIVGHQKALGMPGIEHIDATRH